MGLPCRSSRKERCRVDGPSRAGAAPRDDRAQPGNLWAARGEIQRSGQDVALVERSSTSLCLSRMRRGRGRLPGAQLHAGVCRGAGHVPERLAGSEADGNVALWRGCTLRVSGNWQSRRARTPMGKARYIDPNPAGWEIRKFTYENPWTRETIERDRVFIPSKLQDNKFLGQEYVANLQMVGSDTLVRAWLEGDWTVIEGAYFDCWRYEQHVLEPFEVPSSWARFRSMDWGSAKPFSVGWWAIVGDDHCLSIQGASRIIPRGALLRYREWYGAASPQCGAQDDRRGCSRGHSRARAKRRCTPLRGARSRVLQRGRRPLHRRANEQVVDPGAPAPIPRCRQFARSSARIECGHASSARMAGRAVGIQIRVYYNMVQAYSA